MAKKNKAKKTEEEGEAPKSSPKVEPAEAPAEGKKKKKNKDEKPKQEAKDGGADPEEKARLTKEAIKEILAGISQPDAQKNAVTFLPPDWSTKYKPVLGGYKKFVQSQPEKLVVMEGNGGNFVIRKAGDTTACPDVVHKKGPVGDWKKELTRAWNTYCTSTPKHERSIDAFVAALPMGVRKTKPENSNDRTKPKSPKAAPADAPAEGGGKKKKKGNAEAAPESNKRKEPPAEETPAEGGKKKKKKAKTA